MPIVKAPDARVFQHPIDVFAFARLRDADHQRVFQIKLRLIKSERMAQTARRNSSLDFQKVATEQAALSELPRATRTIKSISRRASAWRVALLCDALQQLSFPRPPVARRFPEALRTFDSDQSHRFHPPTCLPYR